RSLAVEASGRLVGPPVFKTGEGLKSPWRVRFPSASATASADPPGPMPSPRQRLRRCCGGFDSRPPPLLRRRTRLARCHLPASGFAVAVAGSIPVRLRYCVGGPAWPDAISPPAALPLLWRVRFPSASATALADPPGPIPSPLQPLCRCFCGLHFHPPPLPRLLPRLPRCHLPASGFAGALAGSIPVRLRYRVGGPAWPDAISPPAALPVLWRVRFPSASATAV